MQRDMTLGEWLDMWLLLYVEPSGLAQNTKMMYNRAVRAVPPALCAVDLRELNDLDLLPWLLTVAREHPRAAQLDRLTLHRALAVAGKLGLCSRGLVDDDTCPRIHHSPSETAVLTLPELRRYMETVLRLEEPEWPILAFCACGLRRGEARGVTWGDVDFSTALLTINGQRQGQGPKKPLKTRASARGLFLPRVLVEKLGDFPRGDRGAFVCPSNENAVYRLHRRCIIDAVGMSRKFVTLHGLRHSVATACVGLGYPVRDVSWLLGHSTARLTLDVYANHLRSSSSLCEHLFV